MNKDHKIPYIIWIGFSLLVIFLSLRLGLKDDTGLEGAYNPGPGLMPFLTSLSLLLVSSYLLLRSLLGKSSPREIQESGEKKPGRVHFIRIILVPGSLLAYALLLEKLGYLIATCSILILLFRVMGSGWVHTLAMSLGVALITYLFFTHLGLRFPEGILGLSRVLG